MEKNIYATKIIPIIVAKLSFVLLFVVDQKRCYVWATSRMLRIQFKHIPIPSVCIYFVETLNLFALFLHEQSH